MTDNQPAQNVETTALSPAMNALFIGVLVGIIIWSVTHNSLGFFTLIPLYMIYRLIKGSRKTKD